MNLISLRDLTWAAENQPLHTVESNACAVDKLIVLRTDTVSDAPSGQEYSISDLIIQFFVYSRPADGRSVRYDQIECTYDIDYQAKFAIELGLTFNIIETMIAYYHISVPKDGDGQPKLPWGGHTASRRNDLFPG